MILFLEPYFETKPWAGQKLSQQYDCPDKTGEAWLVSGYKGKSSKITNGKFKGQTLRHLWNKNPELFGNFNDKEFPLLIKIIDAKEKLSVQVHPNDTYALQKHNSLGKFECWYILDEGTADKVIAGVEADTQTEILSYIEHNILEEKLIQRDIKAGDLVIIEPGTVHALQEGSFVLEIQESSDITYRLFDYNRIPEREIHLEDSLNVIRYNDNRNPVYNFQEEDEYDNKFFQLKKIFINGCYQHKEEGFEIFYVLCGECKIDDTIIQKGDSFILTAGSNSFVANGKATLMAIKPKKKEESRLKMKKVALITGITTQDGSYLAELLIEKGYEVHGLITSKSQVYKSSIQHLVDNANIINKQLFFHIGDLTDSSNLNRVIENVKPDEIYNLASQSHIDVSYELPEYTADVNAIGTLRLLDAIKQNDIKTKLFNESTSQLFSGDTELQDENTPVSPKNPYATSKLYSHFIVKNYREAYGIFAVNGIMFNHSSPREDEDFIGRKITKTVAAISKGKKDKLVVGNINAMRDWGYAKDYVEGMWLTLQQEKAEDYVFATGNAHSIKEFIEIAFKKIGIELIWQGTGIKRQGLDKATGKVLVEIDPKLYRLSETNSLKGNSQKAQQQLNWRCTTNFEELIQIMIEHDLKEIIQ